MVIFREQSNENQERCKLAYAALATIGCLAIYEGYNGLYLHKFSLMGWGYNLVLLGLWVWRCKFVYTYTLTEKELIVEKSGLGQKKTTKVELAKAFSLNPEYKSSIFRRTKVNRFQHRYSSVDSNKQRLLVYKHGTHLWGMLFKAGDKFIDQLVKILPSDCLQGNI